MRTLSNVLKRKGKPTTSGFSLIEVMVAMVVLVVGLVGLLAVFSYAVSVTSTAQQDMIAKLLASEAMESIFTARETAQVQWIQIQNTGTGNIPDGIFLTGFQPINQAGPDGIYGTADDAPARTLTLPGPDGTLGTPDDRQLGLTNYQRQIVITPIQGTDSVRLVTITISYTVTGAQIPKSYILTAYISQYR